MHPRNVSKNDPHIEETARMLRCLAHPVRLCILDLLERKGEMTPTAVYEALELEQPVASQHLSLMQDRGVLDRRKEGVHAYYRIVDDRALKVLACIRSTES